MRLRIPVLALAASAITLVTAGPATATYTAPDARNDRAQVAAGDVRLVSVLGNDVVYSKAKAKVSVVRVPAGFSARVDSSKRLVIRPGIKTRPGSYSVAYKVTDVRGRTDTASVSLTVQAPRLRRLVSALVVATEQRTGYDRDLFNHWIDADKDGCDTRREVLIAEAAVAPVVGSRCSFTGGRWTSYYDGKTTTDSSTFDIDHMVPLAEAWDSGASAWSATTREAYANDLGDPRSLVGVTAASNRSKSDQDPAEWMPPSTGVACRYVTEWVVVKHRWSLKVDTAEKSALTKVAAACADTNVVVRWR